MYVWVPVKHTERERERERVLKGNRFGTLTTESEVQLDFTWRV